MNFFKSLIDLNIRINYVIAVLTVQLSRFFIFLKIVLKETIGLLVIKIILK